MKKQYLFSRSLTFSLFIGALLALPGCRTDVDLNNIDPAAQVQMGLALPVGTVSATMNDFLKGDVKNYIGVEDDGLLFFEDTFRISRDFHSINLTQYISDAHEQFVIGSSNPALVGSYIPAGTEVQLDFPLHLELSGINTTLDEERIDSIYIREARFSSVLSLSDLNLPYEDIKKLEIILSDNISRKDGKVIEIPLTGASYNDSIHILLDEFTINLMKDKNAEPSNRNVLTGVDFTFRFTIMPGQNVPILSSSAINYDFKVQFLDYYAIWGFFKPSNLMRDRDSIRIADEWEGWKSIQKLHLQLAEPRITMHAYQSLGCPLTLNAEYLYVESEESGEKEYATFNGNRKYIWAFPNFVDPRTEPIGATVTNTLIFDHTESNGRLDKLFSLRPDIISYQFDVVINQSYSSTLKQHRLTKNTDINIEAIAHLPFIFNPNVELSYTDTLKDIDLSNSSIDSLIANVNMIDSVQINELKLILLAKNYIPFNIKATFRFFDENDQEIHFNMLEDDSNTITIAGPTEIENRVVKEPGNTSLIIRIDQEEYDKLASVKYIVYDTFLGENTASVRVLDRSNLQIKIGVAADVKALLNLDFNQKK